MVRVIRVNSEIPVFDKPYLGHFPDGILIVAYIFKHHASTCRLLLPLFGIMSGVMEVVAAPEAQIVASASFLAELSVSSLQKLFIFII